MNSRESCCLVLGRIFNSNKGERIMQYLYGAMMILALVGMIACSKKQKTNPAMQPVAFVLFILVVIGAIMLLKEMEIFGGTSSLLQNELKFYYSQGSKVGQYLGKTNGNKKVLFVTEPGFNENENLKGLVEAFKKGYGANNVVVDTVTVPGAKVEEGMPLYMMMKAKDFDALLAKHADAQVVVTTIGLPTDVGRMDFWKTPVEKRPVMFLLGMPNGQVEGLAGAIAKGDIAGVVISNPNAQYDLKAPGDADKAFDIRYILVTKDNVEQYKSNLM